MQYLFSLEPRRLMAAGAYTTYHQGTVRVFGTAGNDSISVALTQQLNVEKIRGVDGLLSSDQIAVVADRRIIGIFDPETVRRVFIYAGDGNDRVEIFRDMTVTKLLTDVPGFSKTKTYAPPSVLNGGAGDDTLIGGDGHDTLTGGDGVDTVDYSSVKHGITAIIHNISLAASDTERYAFIPEVRSNEDEIDFDVEAVIGTAYDDSITGNWRNNTLVGNAGNDSINGGDGDDYLSGGAGDDVLSASDVIKAVSHDALGHPGTPGAVTAGVDRVIGGGGRDQATVDTRDQYHAIASLKIIHSTPEFGGPTQI